MSDHAVIALALLVYAGLLGAGLLVMLGLGRLAEAINNLNFNVTVGGKDA